MHSASLSLEGRPDDVPQVRRLVAELPGLSEDLRNDAVLVASELTTNACLHGRPPIQVGILVSDDAGLRVEVSDVGRSMPVRPQPSEDAMTGRGFALIAAVAQRWGVDPLPSGGKVVWAELCDGASPAVTEPEIDVDALVGMWADRTDDSRAAEASRHTVRLGAVPTELLLEAKSHIDDVVRELTLASAEDDVDQLSPAMQRLVAAVTEDFAEARAEIKRQALEAAGRGELVTELTLHLPLSAAEAGERYLAALDEIDRQSRAARMLTLAPPRSHRIFRQWYLRALIDQLRALGRGATSTPPRPFSQVLVGAVDELAALLEIQRRLELLQDITAKLTDADTVEEMAGIVVERAVVHAGVESARVFTVTDRGTLRSVASRGRRDRPLEAEAEFPLDANLPGAEVVRTGQPLHAHSMTQVYDRFPALAKARQPVDCSFHQVPLTVAGHVIGLLALTFRSGEVADEAQPSFVRAMGDVLAQAIERSLAGGRVEVERQRELTLLRAQREALASVVAGRPLTGVLDRLLRATETASLDGMLASVLLVGEDGTQLRHVSAPSLSAERRAVIDGIDIGPLATIGPVEPGAGGRWVEYPDLAERAGVDSCWVTPVAGKGGGLGGAFAVYYRRPGRPGDSDLSVVEVMADTVALIVERSRSLHSADGSSLADEAAQRLAVEVAVTAGGVGTFDWNLETGELVWDNRLFDMFGFAEDRRGVLEIGDFFETVHPGDRERIGVLLRQALDEVGDFDAEYRILLPGDETRWIAARGKALAGPEGTTARFLGAAQDTTVRREAEARVARAMDSLSTAFFFLDREWQFTFLNAEAERVLERSRTDLLGHSIWGEFPASVGSDFETYYRHAARTGEPVAFEAYYPEPLNAWYETRAWPNPDGLAVYFLDVTDRRRAHEAAQQAINRAGLLARVTEELAETLDAQEAMHRLAEMVVPMLAEWCVVTLINDDRQVGDHRGLEYAAGYHSDPAKRALVERYAAIRLEYLTDHALIAKAVDTADPQVLNRDGMAALQAMFRAGSEPVRILEELDTYAVAVLPLVGQAAPVGMLSMVNSTERGSFSVEDLDLLRDIAARAGLVLDRGRLYRQQRGFTGGLQRSLLKPPPAGGGRQIAVRYVPAAEVARVGGDWYDAFDQRDGSTVLVIGDVMGHDLLAAAAMGEARMLVRTLAAQSAGDPARVLAEAERVMRTLRLDTLATVLVARLEPARSGESGRRLRFCNAGHPPPMVLSADGRVEVVDGEPANTLLGVGDLDRGEHEVILQPGATVVLFTDGLVERRGQPIEDGMNRLAAALTAAAGSDPEQLCDAVLAAMMPERPEDDVALLAVRI